ncbi:MAG: deoxyribonuclease IV [Negativicutes bacterium]|nr:deoxyribonuclease IV [Negativicutes bacterium]
MLNIGCHLSIGKGYYNMGKEALSIGANTFQFFSRNPRGGKAKAMNLKDIEALTILAKENNFAMLMAHAPYTMNACSPDPKIRNFAIQALREDLETLEYLPSGYYVFHPGSHVGQGVDMGIGLIADMLNTVISPRQKTTVLLETMSGKGSEIGSSFEELRSIIDLVEVKDKIGVCLDTCHVFDAGYDIVNDLDGVLKKFDEIIGLDYLKAVHCNDSLNILGSHKDRHAGIGKGMIGLDAMKMVINHRALRELPFYLETPNDLIGYAEEIKVLRALYLE